MKIYPVILAGGSGTRLWPLSRKSYPKQFSPLSGDESLLQSSARRVSGPEFAAPLILTGSDFRFIVTEQMHAAHLEVGNVLIEPEGRNTAPAVLAAAFWLEKTDPNAVMLIAPSDHAIPDTPAFVKAVLAGVPAAQAGQLVTFGITPDRPETGYGYIELPTQAQAGTPVPATRFVEKPDAELAQTMLEAGNFLWNAGIFLFSVTGILKAFRQHAPALLEQVRPVVTQSQSDLGFQRLDPAAWALVDNISIDHAIMEKSDALVVVPFEGSWSDLGDWNAVSREHKTDASGNALEGAADAIDCTDSLLWSSQNGPLVMGIGLRDTLVVATGDAVLVADRSRAQDVKLAVARLQAQSRPEADCFPWDHRPWGGFETLALGSRFQVKRIVVKPGGILSLQSHNHRAEHWIVVEGTARVTIGDEVQLISENQSVYVPLGATHRMENPGKVPMVLIEVQTGSYLGEDDITRYEDVYARGQGSKG